MRNGRKSRVVRLDEAGLRRLVRGILREAATKPDLTRLMGILENFVAQHNRLSKHHIDSFDSAANDAASQGLSSYGAEKNRSTLKSSMGISLNDFLFECSERIKIELDKLLPGKIHNVQCFSAGDSNLTVDNLMNFRGKDGLSRMISVDFTNPRGAEIVGVPLIEVLVEYDLI
jgi:hypothetical protein